MRIIPLYNASSILICQLSKRTMSELTSMQAACWFGRITESDLLGGVAAHLYVEFDTQTIDLEKLEMALQRVYLEHPILRMSLDVEGIPHISPSVEKTLLEVDDLTALNQEEQQQHLLVKREHWTHQQLDLTKGQTARFSVSLLDENKARLHIDTDMIAVDPSSFCRLVEDLALFYEEYSASFTPVPFFFDWYDKVQADSDLKQLRRRDRAWWKNRLSNIAPMPALPFYTSINATANEATKVTPTPPQSHRLSEQLTAVEWQALKQLARYQKITLSSLVLSLFAYTLSQATQDTFFRLNVPTFWREPLVEGVDRCIGDFANFVIVNVDTKTPNNLAELSQNIASQMIELLEHSHYAGVNIMRDLSRYHGTAQLAPVVFTAALDLPEGELFSERVKHVFGSMNWTVSQGPQVALDAQIVHINDGILINWDMRLDSLPLTWVTSLFNTFVSLLKEVSEMPSVLEADFDKIKSFATTQKSAKKVASNESESKKIISEKPLSSMQQAYLLGRTTQLPLGGVAMQEFRHYFGCIDTAVLKQRLTDIVKKHDSLRTYININKLTQYVKEDVAVNLTEIDLTEMSQQAASAYITFYQDTYSHQLFDLDTSPWDITVFRLSNNCLSVFVLFDALILDGRSIASIMIELFEEDLTEQDISDPHQADSENESDTTSDPETQRKVCAEDMAYWNEKLAHITQPPKLPWIKPLDQLGIAHFERQSLVIPKASFRQVCRVGAKQSLFKNSVIMSLILKLLASWSSEHSVYVAIPVLPLYSGSFSNNSTFITVEWQSSTDAFDQQASKLQSDVLEGLQHLSFSGVDLARLLFEKCGRGPVLPIVITNGLSWPALPESNSMRLEDGLTQTPQVAIDIRFNTQDDGALVFNIDYVPAAIAPEDIRALLDAIDKAIQQIVTSKVFSFDVLECFPNSIQNNIDNTQNQNGVDNQTADELFNIYVDVINQSYDRPIDKTMDFVAIGLRPHHLKTISKRLHDVYSVELSLPQLLQCRNVNDVEVLLKAV